MQNWSSSISCCGNHRNRNSATFVSFIDNIHIIYGSGKKTKELIMSCMYPSPSIHHTSQYNYRSSQNHNAFNSITAWDLSICPCCRISRRRSDSICCFVRGEQGWEICIKKRISSSVKMSESGKSRFRMYLASFALEAGLATEYLRDCLKLVMVVFTLSWMKAARSNKVAKSP